MYISVVKHVRNGESYCLEITQSHHSSDTVKMLVKSAKQIQMLITLMDIILTNQNTLNVAQNTHYHVAHMVGTISVILSKMRNIKTDSIK